MSSYMPPKQQRNNKCVKSISEPSSNGSSPPASVNLTNGNNMSQVVNNNNLNNNNNNAPKYGTLVPNRVFVGGISSTTTETELCQLFSKYGNVKATKIIADRAGVSKGYGFVTFETDEEAKRLQSDAFPQRVFEATASPPPMPTQIYMSNNGIPYHFKNGTAFFQAPQMQAAPMPVAPEMYPGAAYMPAQAPQAYAPLMYPNQPVYINQYPHHYQPLPMQNPIMYSQQIASLNNGTESQSPISMSPHGTPQYFVPPPAAGEYYMPPVPAGQYPPYGPPPVMVATIPEQPALQYCTDAPTPAPAAVDQPSTYAPAEVSPEQIVEEDAAPQEHQEQQATDAPAETPVVSLRNLEKVEDGGPTNHRSGYRNTNRRGGYRGGGPRHQLANTVPKYPFANNNSPMTCNKNNINETPRGGFRGGRGAYHRFSQNGGRRANTRSQTPSPSNTYPNQVSSPNPQVQQQQHQHQQPQQQYRSMQQLHVQPYMQVQPMQVQAQSGANAPQPRRYQNGGRRSHTNNSNNAHHTHARKRESVLLDNGAAGDGCNQHAPPSTLPPTKDEQELCLSLKNLNVQ
ncbi:polyadenylate-binding protein, cytoplasmic and nuclear isoform X2 [Nilaparvata lugens]|uniref:polyadenylate-binding protein, cytoplasmic and nuclear isoform X2 n=1 Tax=Nilaparvata lugens TaxID=108931 RepID=UPI00193DD8B4|nr:polyadenylate-binding protein, cytoplasmic and nuclear isoform X2 [Nilaparvata lugens]